jgi:hypothetical protein
LGNAALASSFQLSDMTDGVLAFSRWEHAERFAADLLAQDVGGIDVSEAVQGLCHFCAV